MRDANLNNANLRQANLRNANLNSAKLILADLSSADLSGANFIRAEILGANLSCAKVENTLFGYNDSISESLKQDLIRRGAIFEDSPGDRSKVLTRV